MIEVVSKGKSVSANLMRDQVPQAHKLLADVLVGGDSAAAPVLGNFASAEKAVEGLCEQTRSSATFTPGVVTVRHDKVIGFGLCNQTEITTVNGARRAGRGECRR